MAKNMLAVMPKLSAPEKLALVIFALAQLRADYRALPREVLKRRLPLLCRDDVMTALRIYGTAAALDLLRELEEMPT